PGVAVGQHLEVRAEVVLVRPTPVDVALVEPGEGGADGGYVRASRVLRHVPGGQAADEPIEGLGSGHPSGAGSVPRLRPVVRRPVARRVRLGPRPPRWSPGRG